MQARGLNPTFDLVIEALQGTVDLGRGGEEFVRRLEDLTRRRQAENAAAWDELKKNHPDGFIGMVRDTTGAPLLIQN